MAVPLETTDSNAETLAMAMDIEAAVQAVYRAWTDPIELVAWWPQSAETEVRVGGSYVLRWPSMEWVLRGTYTAIQPPDLLEFTWSWDHEPDVPQRWVSVDLAANDAGRTTMTVRQGTYGPADVEERQGHVEGWSHFLPKLEAHLTG